MGQEASSCTPSPPCSQPGSRKGSKEILDIAPRKPSSRKGSKETESEGTARLLGAGRKPAKADAKSETWKRNGKVVEFQADTKPKSSVTSQLAKTMMSKGGRQELKALFDSIDKDKSGLVTRDEWAQGVWANKDLCKRYFEASTQMEIYQAFKRLDLDGNNKLSWAEFQLSAKAYNVAERAASAMATPGGQAAWKAIFTFMDKDGDGKVTSEEFSAALLAEPAILRLALGDSEDDAQARSQYDVQCAFKMLDKDGNGVLDWKEFVAASQSFKFAHHLADAMASMEGREELKHVFETIDLDGDGKVTAKEWRLALERSPEVMRKVIGCDRRKELNLLSSDIEEAFTRIDADKNGSLSWSEFESAALNLKASFAKSLKIPGLDDDD